MIIQINLDTIRWRHNSSYESIAREESEYVLGEKIIELYRRDPFDTIYFLNGPGSFTNLRLGSIVANTLKTIVSENIVFKTIDKISFWHNCHTHQAVPQYGILYIGQKKNARLFDALTQNYEKVSLSDIEEKEDLFWEDIALRESLQKALLSFSDEYCQISLSGKETSIPLDQFPRETVEEIHPHYVIEPNISKPKKTPFVS